MNFFTLIFQMCDVLLNIATYPLYAIVNIINVTYILYSNMSTNMLVSTILYLLEHKNSNIFCNYAISLINLHLNFDFFILEPFVNLISNSIAIYAFNTISYSIHYILSYCFNLTLYASIFTSTKFIFIIALLVFVRGGIPRYRFDYLTKLGWTKFLSLILLSFLLELYLIWIF